MFQTIVSYCHKTILSFFNETIRLPDECSSKIDVNFAFSKDGSSGDVNTLIDECYEKAYNLVIRKLDMEIERNSFWGIHRGF